MFDEHLARWRRSSAETAAPLVALLATLILAVFLSWAGKELRNDDAPRGGLSLQFAWHDDCAKPHCASKIVGSWHARKGAATVQVLADFPFIVAYAYLLFAFANAAARDAGNRNRPQLARFSKYAALAGLLAGAFDVVENFGLLTMLWLTPQQPLPLLTSLVASAKFALIGIALLTSFVIRLWPVRRSTR